MSYLDPRFVYHAAATHADSSAFRQRQLIRLEESQRPEPPYPFCLHPDQCAGKSQCPRDPTCAD